MKKIALLVGSWDMDIEVLNKKGEVVSRPKATMETTSEMGGQLILSCLYLEKGNLAQRNWKFFDQTKGKLYDVTFDNAGNFEVRAATRADGNLVFNMVEPFVGSDGVPRDWRKTYKNFAADSFDVSIDYSEDGGNTWTLVFREHFTRRGASESAPQQNQSLPPSSGGL